MTSSKGATKAKRVDPLAAAGRYRVQLAGLGWQVGSKVEGVLSSAVSVRVGDVDVRLDALFPLDERALVALEIAAVWRTDPDQTRRAAATRWQRGRAGMERSWEPKSP